MPSLACPAPAAVFSRRLVLAIVAAGLSLLACTAPATALDLRGLWISPDWLFRGDAARSESEARSIVRDVLEVARRAGANALFVEALNRGQAIGPGTSAGLPVYPLVRWDYRQGNGKVYDLLQIFIDEGKARGIAIHAWVHLSYFRSDSETLRKPWQDGPTIFDGLLADDLAQAGRVVRSLARRRAVVSLVEVLRKGYTRAAFDAVLDHWGVGSSDGRLGGLIRWLEACDAPAPSMFLTTPPGDLHYGFEQDRILALYVNPMDPRVRTVVSSAVLALVAGHPGLAGVHLDHARYPRSPLGPPGALTSLSMMGGGLDRAAWDAMQTQREQALTELVAAIRRGLPSGMLVTCAVMPDYYSCRRAGPGNFGAWVSQDWASWDLDAAIPLAYGKSAGQVAAVIEEARGAVASHGGRTQVIAGTSARGVYTMSSGRNWAVFDMTGLKGQIEDIPGSALLVMGLGDRMF